MALEPFGRPVCPVKCMIKLFQRPFFKKRHVTSEQSRWLTRALLLQSFYWLQLESQAKVNHVAGERLRLVMSVIDVTESVLWLVKGQQLSRSLTTPSVSTRFWARLSALIWNPWFTKFFRHIVISLSHAHLPYINICRLWLWPWADRAVPCGDCVLRLSRGEVRVPHPERWPSAFDLQLAWRQNISQRCCRTQRFKAGSVFLCERIWSLLSWQRIFNSTDGSFSASGSRRVAGWPRLEISWFSKELSISTESLLISACVNMWENIVGSVQNPYVISRCGIFNGQSSDLPHYQVNHTYSLSHFPSFSFSLSLSHVCIYSCTYSMASDLCRTQTRPACVAGDNCPARVLLHRWNRLSGLSLHFSFFQSLPSVHLCGASLSLSSLLVISIVWQYWVFVVSSSS